MIELRRIQITLRGPADLCFCHRKSSTRPIFREPPA
jgi:hypothetical protein